MVLNHLFRDAPSVFDIFAGGDLLERCLAAGNMDSCVELFQLLSVCALNRNHFAQVQCRSIVSFKHIARAVAHGTQATNSSPPSPSSFDSTLLPAHARMSKR